jgi:hypothetical protein
VGQSFSFFTGVYNGLRYQNGALLTGAFEGLRYQNGALFTGGSGGVYYIAGELKSGLDESGSGVSGGRTYVNGVVQRGNSLPPNYRGVWDNFTFYSQDDIVSLNGQYWILVGHGGWTVGGAPGLGYGWAPYGGLMRISGSAKFLGRVKL